MLRPSSVRSRVVAVVCLALGVAMVVGCSSSLSDPTLKGTVPTNVPKAKLIADGDDICAATDARIALIPEPVAPDDIDPFFRQSLDALRDEVRKLQALGTPDADADQLAAALAKATKAYDELERRIPDLAKDPNLMNTDPTIQTLMAEAGEATVAFGFKVCGQTSATAVTGGSVPGTSAVPLGSASPGTTAG